MAKKDKSAKPESKPAKKEKKAKAPAITLEALNEAVLGIQKKTDELAARLLVVEQAAAASTVELPDPSAIKGMEKDKAIAVAKQIGLKIDGLKEKAVKALLKTVALAAKGEDVEKDDVNAVLDALGIKKKKKHDDNVEELKKYLGATGEDAEEEESEDDEDSDDDDDDDEDSDDDSDDDDDDDEDSDDDDDEDSDDDDDEDSDDDDDDDESEDSEDDDEDEDEDEEEEKPKKGKKSKDEDEDEDEDEESDDDDDDDEESEDDDDEESDDDDDDEESDDDDEDSDDEDEEESEAPDFDALAKKLVKKNGKAFEKHLKDFHKAGGSKKVKTAEALIALSIDNEGDLADWGTPYAHGDEAFCCGMPLKDVKGKKNVGECQVTGKKFKQTKDGGLEEL